jgi:hypothetical protein
MKTVLCMKWGRKYGAHFVNALFAGVTRNLTPPFRFLCLTDDAGGLADGIETAPLPELPFDIEAGGWQRHEGTWRKIAVFRRGLAALEGPILFLDIDVVIVGGLDRLFDYAPGRFAIIRDWVETRRRPLRRLFGSAYHPHADINTSVFRYEMPKHAYVFEHLAANRDWVNATFRIEQQYLGATIGDRAYWPDEWVISFKRSCRRPFPLNLALPPKAPSGASVIAFHGRPNPDEAIAGMGGSPLYSSRPAPWLAEYWREPSSA